jgi:uridine phosphorylase
MKSLSGSDLILNPDGSIYHLNLLPEDVADTVITVGDPDRVAEVSKRLDSIQLKKGKREFITHTGYLGRNRVTVLSTGIGTDNIDIVLNELDALVNIDLKSRTARTELKSLNIIRIGTSGSLQDDVPVDSILVSTFGLGLDALMNYYFHQVSGDEHVLLDEIKMHFHHIKGISPYITSADESLVKKFAQNLPHGITVTAPGFYAPQGREVRAQNAIPNLLKLFKTFKAGNQRITNLEMETAGIYALSKALGHKALSVNAVLASRVRFEFSKNPQQIIAKTIEHVLSNI